MSGPRLALALLAAACAAVEDPPGGPPDFTAPVLLATTPDSAGLLADRRAAVRFQFNEVIQERGLADLVTISPRHDAVRVDWQRAAVTVRPDGGWRDSVAYVVTLAPGIADLRNNRLRTPATLVFSTGGPLPATAVAGTVIDWDNGRRAAGALVEAIRADSLTYLTTTDSAGAFILPYVPPGPWTVIATVEQNANRRRERREPFDSTHVMVAVGDTVRAVLWTVTHDTAGATLRDVQRSDSVTMRLTFDERLAPAPPATDAVRLLLLPDSIAVAIDTVLTESAWATRRDTLPALPDTVPPADPLLTQRPALSSVWYVVVAAPFAPGARYLVEARATSAAGHAATSRAVLALPDTAGGTPR